MTPEQIALLRDAAKYVGLVLEPSGGPKADFYCLSTNGWWHPHEDHGDLYDLMAAGKVNRDSSGLVYIEVEKKLIVVTVQEEFDPDSFESEAWAVITVCAMAERRKGK